MNKELVSKSQNLAVANACNQKFHFQFARVFHFDIMYNFIAYM